MGSYAFRARLSLPCTLPPYTSCQQRPQRSAPASRPQASPQEPGHQAEAVAAPCPADGQQLQRPAAEALVELSVLAQLYSHHLDSGLRCLICQPIHKNQSTIEMTMNEG